MNLKNSRAKSVADLSRGTILARVEIDAAPERVFRAITEEVSAWWGSPESYQVTEWQSELRVGGRWKSVGKGSDGTPFSVSGEYLEIEAPSTLKMTWEAPWDGGNVTTVRYQLDAIDGGTRVTLWHEGFAGRVASCADHEKGWATVLGWLVKHVGTGVAQKTFFCRLIGPRPTFPKDITAEERAIMAEHATYCRGLVEGGIGVAFGPVFEGTGAWGAGIIRVTDEAHARAITDADPTVKSGKGFRWELSPMGGLIA